MGISARSRPFFIVTEGGIGGHSCCVDMMVGICRNSLQLASVFSESRS